MKRDLLDLTLDEISYEISLLGWPKFRSTQIFRWLYKGIKDFMDMTNLSINDRETLISRYNITELTLIKKQDSKKDETVKFLFQLPDGEMIESVLMKYKHGSSACLSTQVGCAMACSFCASGQEGLIRNLTAGEMVDQILSMSKLQSERIRHVVLMGSGEPLQNLGNVVKLMKIINENEGLNISLRHVTLSTCGLIPEIKKLANYNLPINLAISLHASNDETRRRLMPVSRGYTIKELISTCDEYSRITGRRVTYEYALIKGVNDSVIDIQNLARLLKGKLCHVNLIPINPIEGSNYQAANKSHLNELTRVLVKEGIVSTVRRELGSDIDAACGQLKRRTIKDY